MAPVFATRTATRTLPTIPLLAYCSHCSEACKPATRPLLGPTRPRHYSLLPPLEGAVGSDSGQQHPRIDTPNIPHAGGSHPCPVDA